ncbi:hypothetical protein FLA_3433 [Filimonas lacunae]|nr:hypothetical protein FLA_3433 [Filimonas lacunae]
MKLKTHPHHLFLIAAIGFIIAGHVFFGSYRVYDNYFSHSGMQPAVLYSWEIAGGLILGWIVYQCTRRWLFSKRRVTG